jgi:tetratricopeptide (TPR) repeat protein
MQLPIPSLRPRVRLRFAFAAALFACFALVGCDDVDPLEAVRQQQQAGKFKESIEPLRELLAKQPDHAETNFLYGRALARTEPNLATPSLRKAMQDPEWLVPAGSQLAYLALAALDFNEVEKITSQILERDPDNVRVLFMRANGYAHSKRNPEQALAIAKRVLEIDRDATEAYEPMILALLQMGKLKEASEALAEAGGRIEELGMSEGLVAWHCVTTAMFEQEAGELEDSRKTWQKCLEAHPTDLDVVSSSINFYNAQGEPGRSLEILRTAHAGAPDVRPFRIALAQKLQLSGDRAGAEAVLLEATKSEQPELAAAAWVDLGKFRQDLEDYAGAADAIERAVEVREEADAEDPQILFEYADALVLADRLDRALEVAEDLPVPTHQNLIRGRVAQERRQPAQALKEYEAAVRLWPNNPWARYYMALAAEELGDFERALEDYRNAIRADPGATDARTRGAALLLASGNLSGAMVVLQTDLDKPLDLEGQLLGMRLAGLLGNTTAMADFLSLIQQKHPAWAGKALAEAADGLARRAGPEMALSMLTTAPQADFHNPSYAPALRSVVLYSHRAGIAASARPEYEKILESQPDSSAFQEIRAFDLELSGAPADEVKAAYLRALELDPGNALALTALGRLSVDSDPEAALGYFDRAAAADASNPDPDLGAAKALVALGRAAEAGQRLDALLLEHPFVAAAAAERARLDLERGVATPQTLERAKRAVRFGGGADALDLLSRTHAKQGEPELAAKAADEARAMREARAAKDKG